MLTSTRITERAAQPYVAMRRRVTIPFGAVIDATLPELFRWLEIHGVEPAGPRFFKYNVIDMARELELEFGVPTSGPVAGDAATVFGTLPAGRYATLTLHGHYDKLIDATGVLIDWVRGRGLAFDSEVTPEGERFVGRFEIYPNDPGEVPNPDDWETEIWIKLQEG